MLNPNLTIDTEAFNVRSDCQASVYSFLDNQNLSPGSQAVMFRTPSDKQQEAVMKAIQEGIAGKQAFVPEKAGVARFGQSRNSQQNGECKADETGPLRRSRWEEAAYKKSMKAEEKKRAQKDTHLKMDTAAEEQQWKGTALQGSCAAEEEHTQKEPAEVKAKTKNEKERLDAASALWLQSLERRFGSKIPFCSKGSKSLQQSGQQPAAMDFFGVVESGFPSNSKPQLASHAKPFAFKTSEFEPAGPKCADWIEEQLQQKFNCQAVCQN